ncbi:hypothetical protein ACJJTC_013105 [Scirpophaga incertulas]
MDQIENKSLPPSPILVLQTRRVETPNRGRSLQATRSRSRSPHRQSSRRSLEQGNHRSPSAKPSHRRNPAPRPSSSRSARPRSRPHRDEAPRCDSLRPSRYRNPAPYPSHRSPESRSDSCIPSAKSNNRTRGHETNECYRKKDESKSILEITVSKPVSDKYVQTVKINGSNKLCYIDSGSECTLIRHNDALELSLKWDSWKLITMRGFGGAMVNSIGSCFVTLEIHSVVVQLNIFIVPDHFLKYPLLIGQSFTDSFGVKMIITQNDLIICKENKECPDLVRLFAKESCSVGPGGSHIEVYSKENITGPILVLESYRSIPNYEHTIQGGLYMIENGRGILIVDNISFNSVEYIKDQLVARGQTVEIKTPVVFNVNKIDINNNLTPFTLNDLCLDDTLSIDERTDLLNVINRFRTCFATKLSELGQTESALLLSIPGVTNENNVSLNEIRREASDNIKAVQSKQKVSYDKSRIPPRNFSIGQLVRVERQVCEKGTSKKLVAKCLGPYRISKILPNDRYEIEDTPITRKKHKQKYVGIYPVDKIYPWLVFKDLTEPDDEDSAQEK